MGQQVQFFFKNVHLNLSRRKEIKEQLAGLFKKEGVKIKQISIVFCSDKFLLEINRDFLAHHYYTDIITFHYNQKNEPVIGELYISADRVKENARNLGTTFKEEIHRVIFHGCLHLCGYNDKSSQQIKKMREREDFYLRSYFSKLAAK
ncbi:MAG: rRNA maturation RNase YbeY [Chitinophagaceae bacterium]|nr:rRNA maturation RNase YbeY [Chitinophagaceae bacterium]